MKLFSFCPDCEVLQPYRDPDRNRLFGDFDKCPKCSDTMELWTEAGVRGENGRRFYAGLPALTLQDGLSK
jgi:hydrogenase maturation factor HypF (carbamoyltransferase family)